MRLETVIFATRSLLSVDEVDSACKGFFFLLRRPVFSEHIYGYPKSVPACFLGGPQVDLKSGSRKARPPASAENKVEEETDSLS